ncbi:DUF1508 domain-containing protein [Breoghania sp.]|uniref:YegP family protein n=1 Tax=Breoghania sp. TaxID=2065378 RepID=UPI002AA7791D|nr:DUF1508 domain-containing protein [Breoghania sp.]
MSKRSFPSYRLYKDKAGEWRWSFGASNGNTIAVSSEGYKKRSDCVHGIELMKTSDDVPIFDEEAASKEA